MGQTVNNKKGACECGRISIGYIEQCESSREVKKRGGVGHVAKLTSPFPDQTQTSLSFSFHH